MSERIVKTLVGFGIRRHPTEYVTRLWKEDRRELEIKDACFVDDLWINPDRMRDSYAPSARTERQGIEIAIRLVRDANREPDEKKALRPAWSGKLNEYGLLRELEDAEQFKTLTDKRVPEHAPFAVFELLLLSPESLYRSAL